jgi:parvulin-like peptidyl-prolyl isomerase
LKEIEYRTWVESDIYQGKLFLSFLEKIPEKAEQVHVFVLVSNDIGKAETIRARLRKGENFNRLALETSIDKETARKGGELGWMPRGVDDLIATGHPRVSDLQTMTKPETGSPGKGILEEKLIDDIAFNLPIGQVSPPLITDKGIYLLKITAREDQRPLSQNHRILLAEKAMREWLAETARKGAKEGWIKGNWGSETFQWVIKHLN